MKNVGPWAAGLAIAAAVVSPVLVFGLEWSLECRPGLAGVLWPVLLIESAIAWALARRGARDAAETRRIDLVYAGAAGPLVFGLAVMLLG